ncbi:sensor domain-containing diguanylate cyclase [Metabacillus indicus]|uniref:sensor domain-containing diguanylate cyclase n=1 Tax=Metabacillus indicus TaxID=246786 RepID=UPI0024922544|nr:sensor domain-containing diguanylate cyclase [Metabacillus indicus]
MISHSEYILLSIKSSFFDYISSQARPYSRHAAEYAVSCLQSYLSAEYVSFFKRKEDQYLLIAASSHSYHTVPFRQKRSLIERTESRVDLMLSEGFLLSVTEKEHVFDEDFYRLLIKECSLFLAHFQRLQKKTDMEKNYQELYALTKRLHATMNKDEVLNQFIFSLQKLFPDYLFYLFLSHDSDSRHKLPVKEFDYEGTGSASAMEAYLTGEIKWDAPESANQVILYAPLKGNQGIYGVVEVTQQNRSELDEDETMMTASLAEAAGHAYENAKLYEQSKKLVSDLQLINETSHKLNKNLRLIDTMTYMSDRIIRSFSADETGFFYTSSEGGTRMLPGSTSFFQTEGADFYLRLAENRVRQELEGVFIGDLKVKDAAFSSLIAIPMVQRDELKGFAVILHRNPYAFTFEMFKLMQSLIHHSTLALMNSMLREELELLVITDHLTKLYSRNYLDDSVQHSLKTDSQGVFILMDIDDFKTVNDTHGHQTGDDILIQVAGIIMNSITKSDVGARWGGEELAVYLPQADPRYGIELANRIVDSVQNETFPSVTISCGVAHWTAEEPESLKRMIRRADQALYKAKENGKNCAVFYEESEVMHETS